jgi:uncharacterized caspase-like protein
MRAEIVGHLPSNPEADRIGNFIDQGFGDAPVRPPARPPQNAQQTPNVPPPQMPVQQPTAPATVSAPPVAGNPNMKVWAVIVGVADYQRKESRLNYTDDDAYRMYAFYKSPEGGSLPDRQITLLIDEEATRANIIDAIQKVYSAAGDDDMLVFYFSGHGSQRAFITYEYDGMRHEDNRGMLLHEELNKAFEQSPARYKYIVADACHSGNSASQYKSLAANEKGTFYQAFDEAKKGFVLLLSSMGNEVSLETSGKRQGIFSYYLLLGLKGESDSNHDKTVSVIELYDYVKKNVQTYTNGSQNPVIAGRYDETLPMAVVRE